MSDLPIIEAKPEVLTEVRIRQFYRKLDGGIEVVPTIVLWTKAGAVPMELSEAIERLETAVVEGKFGAARPMTAGEAHDLVAGEVYAGNQAARVGHTSLQILRGNGNAQEKPNGA